MPSSSTLTGCSSIASSISRIAHGDGVQVVARVPSAGPVPPPISVVIPAATASSTICGQMKCTCPSIAARGQDAPLAGDDLGRRADLQRRVDAVHHVRVAGLAERDDPARRDADVALDDAPVVEHDHVRDHEVRRAVHARALEHRLADRLAAAEHRLVAAEAAVLLDLEPQVGVGEPQPVADRRPVERAVARARDLSPQPRHLPRARRARPASTSRSAPGSKRTDVPAGTSSRKPARRRAVERQRVVDRDELEVRADLDRPVAGVHHPQHARLAPGVELRARRRAPARPGSCDRLVQRHELATVLGDVDLEGAREGPVGLDVAHELGR